MRIEDKKIFSEFIEFLVRNNAVKFGEFTLKSGRESPYFINTGVISNGFETYELGRYYAQKIKEILGDKLDGVYGPAYKGIPLAVSTSIALSKEFGVNKGWLFDRKERKIHGDKGMFVGSKFDSGSKIVIVDDVLTTGRTKIEAIDKIEKGIGADVIGIFIAVDRMEKGIKESAIDEFYDETGVRVYPLTTIKDIFDYLKITEINGVKYIDDELNSSFIHYQKKYGLNKID